jgi:catechol 2,3-dioxygenase
MSSPNTAAFPSIALSHFELYVTDVISMEDFYTRYLGFVVTDRGAGPAGMVFMSRNPREHHQLVLNPRQLESTIESPVDHISFRVDGLADLRLFHDSLISSPGQLQTVSHGTSWSIYFRDPENNRLELFADTPWHVDQPCRFEIDFQLPDQSLIEFTHTNIKDLPGFRDLDNWRSAHAQLLGSEPSR